MIRKIKNKILDLIKQSDLVDEEIRKMAKKYLAPKRKLPIEELKDDLTLFVLIQESIHHNQRMLTKHLKNVQ